MQKSVTQKNKKNLRVDSPNTKNPTSTNPVPTVTTATNSNNSSDTTTFEFNIYDRDNDNGQNDGFKIPNGNLTTSTLKLGPSTQTSLYSTLQSKEANNSAMNANNAPNNTSMATPSTNSGLMTPGTLLGNGL